MFDFDRLFQRHDPYGSFIAELSKDTGDACHLESIAGEDQATIFTALLKHSSKRDLRPAVMSAIRMEAVLVDAYEAFDVACMNVSLELTVQSGAELGDNWIREQVTRAVRTCVELEMERFLDGAEVAYPLLNHHASLRRVLEIPLGNLRLATMHFNELPLGKRVPIMRVFLQGIPTNQVAMEIGISFMELTGRLKSGLMALMKLRLTQETRPS